MFLAQGDLSKLGVADWHLMAFIVIAFASVGYFLLQHGILKSKTCSLIGGVLIATACLLAAVSQKLDFEKVVMFAFCGLAMAGGTTFLTARQPVNAALGFATAILSSAGVLFMQSALFIAAATIIVYAGATIIIFLFVLMFSQQLSLETYELKLTKPLLATIVGGFFLAILVYSLQSIEEVEWKPSVASVTRPLTVETKLAKPASTAALGRSLFTDYLFSVELAGTLLLAATIGAIAVAQRTLEVDV
jgi:NADH-quinone oxidoreductase subunit J